ncbi:MAG: hypothetical protein ACHREM_31820, partial [Polyangiales bacterium]
MADPTKDPHSAAPAAPAPTSAPDGDDVTRAIPVTGHRVRLRGAVLEVVSGPDRGLSIKMESPT